MSLGPRFLIGANYWSRAGGPRMWERFSVEVVRAELAAARAHGVEVVRAFCFIPSMMPSPPTLAAAPFVALAAFLAEAERAGVGVVLSPLVGHMSGENFGFAGAGGRSLYADPELRAWQRALVARTAEVAAASPALRGWALSNEMPLWAGTPTQAEAAAWCAELAEVARAASAGGERPFVGSGDGMMRAWPVRATLPHVDFVAPHVYAADGDPLRQAFALDVALRGALAFGKPVVLEEFGASGTQAGPEARAAYLREAVMAALGAGAAGAWWWCLSDFDVDALAGEAPYVHHGFELGFGLFDASGAPTPAAEELRALATFTSGIDLTRWRPPVAQVALLAPSYLEAEVPFSWDDREAGARTLRQAFVLAAQAGLDPLVVDEETPLDGFRLILCPATQKLRVPTWRRLLEAARAGATVYWSYFSGDFQFHQGAWCPPALFAALTGLEHQLRYGCFDLPAERHRLRGRVALEVPTRVERAAAPHALARLPVGLLPGAPVEVLAVDEAGRPGLTTHAVGSGRVVFATHPIERYLAQLVDGSAREAYRLYELLAELAGVEPPFSGGHPEIQVRRLVSEGEALVLAQNRGWQQAVDNVVDVPRDAELVFDRGNPLAHAFGPKGVRVYRVKNP